MNAAAFVLALAFGGLQTLTFTDCRCAAPCARKAKPSGCDACPSESAPLEGCCGTGEESKKPPCVHIEPSHDVATHAQDLVVTPILSFLPSVDLEVSLEKPPGGFVGADDPIRPTRERPLFLLHSSLLI